MSDRINRITVVLKEDINDQQAEAIENAILCIKGVIQAKRGIVDGSDFVYQIRFNNEMKKKLYKLIEEL